MKPVNLNQLLFHHKCDTLSFFQTPRDSSSQEEVDTFILDMKTQLNLQGKAQLASILEAETTVIKKILKTHPKQSHAFFLSENLQGYLVLDYEVESYCMIGQTFHVRPILEELFTNPEFLVVNVSLYDIKIFRGDFQNIEIIHQFDFDQMPKSMDINPSRIFAPQYLGLVPYKTVLAMKTIAAKIKDLVLYNTLPVIVTGLQEMKDIFLRYFNYATGVITHLPEDFYEKTCMEILERCKSFRHVVIDFYSEQLKERLKRMLKSKLLLTDLASIIAAVREGRVNHLILPVDFELFGSIDFKNGQYEIYESKTKKKNAVDILNALAEEVVKQGGKIQVLRPHFFPVEVRVLAILRGQS